jgi:hypothetical protein
MEDVIASRQETGPLYAQLAALAYEAGQTRKAKLATKKALALTPKDDREQVRAQIDGAKQQATQAAAQQAQQAPPTTSTATGPVAPAS